MNRYRIAGLLLVVAVAAGLIDRSRVVGELRRDLKAAVGRETVWQAKYAEAATLHRKADTVWRVAKARVDSVPFDVHDTIQVLVYRERAEVALAACTELANACDVFHRTADSTITAKDHVIQSWAKIAEANKPSLLQRSWPLMFVLGVVVGAKASR